jgi:hypothetical protein
VSRDIFCFPLEPSARGTITRTRNLVTLTDPDPPGTANRHYIWWFPKTKKAASLECFAPPSRLGFCRTTFRDFDQQVRAYAAG